MILLPTTYYLLPSPHRGQAVLSSIFLIGGIAVAVALSLSFLVTSFINSAYGLRISQRAEAVASSGAADAMMRLLRNKGYSGSYSVSIGSDSYTVTVAQNSPVAGEITITSVATILLRTRTVTVVVSRNATSGLIAVISKTSS